MFTLNNVTLRPLELDDIDTLYSWETDIELAILSGWTPLLSRAAFRHKYEQRITEPKKGLVFITAAEGVPRYCVLSALCQQG
jgi:RimJ/RimL family protein N-acetyltransferase